MPISSAAMLVDLNISVWTANKIDRSATQRVAMDSNASHDAGLFRKNLMAGTHLRKEIADYAAACRLWHNTRTLPWADRGSRLLATSLFFDYKTEVNARQTYFMGKVDQFCRDYPVLQAQAQRALGALYSAEDYPSAEEVRTKFGFRLVFSPVPESGDFRLDLPKQELDEMRQQYDAAFDTRLADAMREPWERLKDMLDNMTKKLGTSLEDTDTKTRWHETFITNARDMCQMLTHLNVTKDPQLEAARKQLENAIRGVDIEDIKEDVTARSVMKDKLDNLLKQYSW
jgi:hypothetical protein